MGFRGPRYTVRNFDKEIMPPYDDETVPLLLVQVRGGRILPKIFANSSISIGEF